MESSIPFRLARHPSMDIPLDRRFGSPVDALIVLPEGGWLLSLEAREHQAADPVYRMRRRLWLKP